MKALVSAIDSDVSKVAIPPVIGQLGSDAERSLGQAVAGREAELHLDFALFGRHELQALFAGTYLLTCTCTNPSAGLVLSNGDAVIRSFFPASRRLLTLHDRDNEVSLLLSERGGGPEPRDDERSYKEHEQWRDAELPRTHRSTPLEVAVSFREVRRTPDPEQAIMPPSGLWRQRGAT